MTDNEWDYFRMGMAWTFLFCFGFMAIVVACSATAQPTPCDRQLTDCRLDAANLRSALAQCQSK